MELSALPLVERDALVRGFRPGSGADAESPFRTLRRKHSVTAGVRLIVHSGGRIAGKYQVFSSLNFDSARLARQDLWDEARGAALAAEQIENSTSMKELVTLLRHLPRQVVEDYVAGRMPDRNDYPLVWHLTSALAKETSGLRTKLRMRSDAGRMGVLVSQGALESVIHMTLGSDVRVPRQMASSLGLGECGSVVALFTEVTSAGQLVLDLLPGFELSGEGETAFNPFARTKEPFIVPEAALTAPMKRRRTRQSAAVPVRG